MKETQEVKDHVFNVALSLIFWIAAGEHFGNYFTGVIVFLFTNLILNLLYHFYRNFNS